MIAASQPTPVSARERLEILDLVRGFALLGIFIMNMPAFHEPLFATAVGAATHPAWWDRAVAVARDILFAGKFNGMFSLLFAVGFSIQLARLRETAATRTSSIFLRKLFWLLVFGLGHAILLWNGDVLHVYALFGLLLITVLHRLSDRTIIALIILTLLYTPVSNVVLEMTATPQSTAHLMEYVKELNAAQDYAGSQGSFVESFRQNLRAEWALYSGPCAIFVAGFYIKMLTTMLIGLLLGRHQVFQNISAHRVRVRRAQWWLLGIGALTGAAFGLWRATVDNPSAPSLIKGVAETSYIVSRLSVMGFYIATIVLAAHHFQWKQWLRPISFAGRMPLTNYLMQSLLGCIIFKAWGFGYWGHTGLALDLLLAVSLFFLVQVPLSTLWLKHFERGPMESLWRRLTYGRRRG